LLEAYIGVIGSPAFVLSKMTAALVAFIIRVLPDHWTTFLSDISQALETVGASSPEMRMHSTLAFLEFLKILVENVETIRLSKEKRSKVEQILIDYQMQVVSIILSLLINPPLIIAQKCVETAKSWFSFGLPMKYVLNCNSSVQFQLLDPILKLLDDDQLFDSVIEMLLVVLANTTIRQQKATYFPKFLFLLTDGIIGLKFRQAFSHDQETLVLISYILLAFGEAFTEPLVLSVGEPDTDKFFFMMLSISGIQGVFPVDEDVSHGALYFWFLVEEIIIELDLIGKGLHSGIVDIYCKLVTILLQKSLFPTNWSSWSQNTKDQFLSYRNDISDTYGYCFEVIQEKSFDIFIEVCEASVSGNYWLLESSVFGIKSLSDYLSSKHLPSLMKIVDLIIPQAETAKIQQLSTTILNFLSEFSTFLNEADIRYLDVSLKFIFSSIRNPKLSKNALVCLEKVCLSCQDRLLNPHFSWVFESMISSSSAVEVLSYFLLFSLMRDID
jgi:hypothetical protein